MITVDLQCPVEGCCNRRTIELEVEQRDGGEIVLPPMEHRADYCDEHASVWP
jgi:hypothetical protein